MVDALARHDVDDSRHRLRVQPVDAVQPLGHHDRVLAVGSEVQVVRVSDRHRLTRLIRSSGSIGTSALPMSLFTHSVFKSYEGTTCCGCAGTAKCSTIAPVDGSMTSTVLLSLFGT